MDAFAARAESPPAIPVVSTRHGLFRLDGDHWVIRRPGGSPILVPDRRGLAMLHTLVMVGEARALDLVASLERDGAEGERVRRALAAETHAPVLDGEALRRYRTRLVRIDAELEAADVAGDAARSEGLVAERQALVDELARSRGLGGRVRRDAGASERARVNVTKHLRRTISDIATRDAVLGAHFADTVRTGIICAYSPSPDAVIEWSDR
jgi:hypothetical protein